MSLIYAAEHLTLSYGNHLALKIPQFSLEKGASLILTGANGSGKSTFLRLLAFLEQPTSGRLSYLGPGEPRRNCTMMLQEAWLLRMNVFQNVVLGLKLRGQHTDLAEKYREAMMGAGFENPEEFAKRKPYMLSGGEKQRIALAARLILNPVVLLLDEPTAYVDSRSALKICEALQKEQAKGTTIICSTHDKSLGQLLSANSMELRRPD